MTHATALDHEKMEAFVERLIGDMGGAMAVMLACLGDRLGLFAELARGGPATPAELAQRARIDERYAAEWLLGMASAGYLEHEPATGRYALPAEHAPALAEEAGPFFVGGALEMMPELLRPIDELAGAFRSGGGVAQAAFDPRLWEGMERFSASDFDNRLVSEWIAATTGVRAALERGGTFADVGCGSARSLIRLAEAFPTARLVGYDAFDGQVDRARANVAQAGLADRVRIELLDVAAGLPERYEAIATFDVVHDAADPLGLLRAIHDGLEPGGSYLLVDIRTADDPHENVGPLATLLYGASVFYCMTTSLANGGAGLGTHGLPETRVRELCAEAGFASVRRLPVDSPFNALYEATV